MPAFDREQMFANPSSGKNRPMRAAALPFAGMSDAFADAALHHGVEANVWTGCAVSGRVRNSIN
jgi:hypothetical protein